MAADSPDRQTRDAGQARHRRARVAIAVFVAVGLFLVIFRFLPDGSSVSTKTCSDWNLICKADAHQGVIASVALLAAIMAGAFAYLSFNAEQLAERRRNVAKVREEEHYWALVHEMLYESLHNLRHLSEVVGWNPQDLSREYEGCKLADWPDLHFRHAEHLLEVPYVSYLEQDLPEAVGFLDHALRNMSWIDVHGRELSGPGVAAHFGWLAEHLLRLLAYARYRDSNGVFSEIAKSVLSASALDDLMNPSDRDPRLSAAIDLRDAVRLVRNNGVDAEGKRFDGRARSTTVAWFESNGEQSDLLRSFKRLPDPPTRPMLLSVSFQSRASRS